MDVPLRQKTYIHRPQAKILEFFVALCGRSAALGRYQPGWPTAGSGSSVALAWQQAGWADYSGVGRTLQALTQTEAEAIGQVLRNISQPLIDEQVTQALATQGRLIYDGDLTSGRCLVPAPLILRPLSATWTMKCGWATKRRS